MKKVREIKKQKDSKTTQKVVLGLFIAFIMVFSMVSVFTGNQNNSFKFNGFKFKVEENSISSKINGAEIVFNYPPYSLENLSYDNNINEMLKNSVSIYVSSSIEEENAQAIDYVKFLFKSEMAKDSKVVLNSYSEVFEDQLQINCDNASSSNPVILFTSSNESLISVNENCVLIEASIPNDFFAFKDRLLYGYYGVLE
jgi:hypothetical protein